MADLVGTKLGDFEVVRELGRGGMGVVYEARQVSLNRRVAFKVLASGLGLTPKAIHRFRREAEAAAKLHHTNIVPVYATGEHDGFHFYAMELIDGPSLDRVIAHLRNERQVGASPQPTLAPELTVTGPYGDETTPGSGVSTGLSSGSSYSDTVARMIAEVADALDHAHRHNIIHRDVKPANLLLGADGRLSVNDFGLARALEEPGMTQTGEFVGTPAYMAPEQIAGGRIPIDHRCDIYSLGATLYELLTLRPPFAADRRDQLLAMVVQKEPPSPHSLNPKVPRDLETICLKCLEKDPDRRYQSATELADDLRRYINRFAILARRAGPFTKFKKWVKRNPALAAALAIALTAVGVAGGFAYRQHLLEQDRVAERARLEEELLAEKRQTALEKAVLEAMSGDTQAALQAIRDAENKGVHPGQLNMLRGLIETSRGNPRGALVYLEQAERQLPESVAIKVLIAQAHAFQGEFWKAQEIIAGLSSFRPSTTEDYVFLGLSQAVMDSDRGLKTLEVAFARARQPALARLTRAQVLSWRAGDDGDPADAERALDDIRKADLPDDHALMVLYRFNACMEGVKCYGAREPARRDALLEQASRDFERLGRYPDFPIAVLFRCGYHIYRDDDEALLGEVRRARARSDSATLAYLEAHVHYRRKQYGEALTVLRTAKSRGGSLFASEGFVLATLPERKAEAVSIVEEAMGTVKGGPHVTFTPSVLLMLGPEYRDRARGLFSRIRDEKAHLIPTARNRWYHDLLAYNAGDARMPAEELLKRAGKSRVNRSEAYFFIALNKLAEGDRAGAKEFLTRCCEIIIDNGFEYTWARAFLACIDDPDWLPWIPLKR
jgi:hypothetical protein